MRRLLFAVSAMVMAGSAGGALAQVQPAPAAAAAAPLSAVERQAVLTDLAQKLEDRFVDPAAGKRYAAMLRARLASGAYADISDAKLFGERVTADLQAVHADGHLRLAPVGGVERSRPPAGEAPRSTIAVGALGMEEARMMGDVAYLRFNGFSQEPEEVAKARDFLLAHADAKAVIIDARPHRGGSLDVIDAIAPLFYDKRTTLLRMDTRASVAGEYAGDGPTLVRRASPPEFYREDQVIPADPETRLRKTPIYYLTSRKTASAGEHLALAFKRTQRATLIGETTRGAGHYGGVAQIGERFAAFIPVGRTYDPDTGWDWEGKGVAPDIAVHTDQALDEALKAARAAGARPAL